MKKLSLLLAAALSLSVALASIPAAPARSYEAHQLKKHHKAERKALKEQQRAMKRVMAQHQLSDDQRARFKNDLKMQKRLLHNGQKDESHNLKQSQKKQNQKHAKTAPHAPSERSASLTG